MFCCLGIRSKILNVEYLRKYPLRLFVDKKLGGIKVHIKNAYHCVAYGKNVTA